MGYTDWILLAQDIYQWWALVSKVMKGFIKCWELLEWLCNCWLFKKDLALVS
jgi:hypothetical protein